MVSLTYLEPGVAVIVIALLIGIALRSRRVLVAATLGLFLWSWDPVASLFARTLEARYPIRDFPPGEAEAIVVLTGGILKHDAGLPEDLPQTDTFIRASYAAWLHRNWRPLPVVVCGGVTGVRKKAVLAEVAGRIVEQRGVPAAQVWLEKRSRSTYENALYAAEMLKEKGINRIVLVTEAHHMARAEASFRRQGLTVTPAPFAYRYVRFTRDPEQFIPHAQAIEQNEIILHEWIGLIWYRLSGKT